MSRISSIRVRWAAIGAAIAVTIGGGAIGIVRATISSGERGVFVPITPCRLFDTRPDNNVGPRATPLIGGETYTQTVHGTNGNCTIPSDAVGVSMNVTTVNGTAASFLTAWPADVTRPLASNLNWVPGAPATPNKVDVRLSADGRVSFFSNAGSVDVLADVVGYYADHNHDDRYYTKGEIDAMDPQGPPSVPDVPPVRLSVHPWGMHLIATGDAGFSTTNDCITVVPQVFTQLPLDLPVGAQIRLVDIRFFDGSTAQVYSARLIQDVTGAMSSEEEIVASTNGGSGSGNFAVVAHRLTPAAPVIVEEGEAFRIEFGGIGNFNNGVCNVVVEYDPPA